MGRGDKIESSASYRLTPMEIEFFNNNDINNIYIAAGGAHSFSYSK